jgi:hypothetical protein
MHQEGIDAARVAELVVRLALVGIDVDPHRYDTAALVLTAADMLELAALLDGEAER